MHKHYASDSMLMNPFSTAARLAIDAGLLRQQEEYGDAGHHLAAELS